MRFTLALLLAAPAVFAADSGWTAYGGDAGSDLLQVIVYSSSGQNIGLVVDEILDIAEQSAAVEEIGKVETLKGAAVIQQRVTDLLDVPALLAAQHLGCGQGAQA